MPLVVSSANVAGPLAAPRGERVGYYSANDSKAGEERPGSEAAAWVQDIMVAVEGGPSSAAERARALIYLGTAIGQSAVALLRRGAELFRAL